MYLVHVYVLFSCMRSISVLFVILVIFSIDESTKYIDPHMNLINCNQACFSKVI